MLFLLDHPSIIKIYDVGMIGPRPFIRMEYFEGKNLNEILSQTGPVPADKALVMMRNVVSAIEHAHGKGIIHRDLKPSNIMAARPNLFRVIDFGLGIFVENELHSRLTPTGEKVSGGLYNAPELVENPRLVDTRSDIYSLGAVWFTMLTGQPPAGSSFMELLKGKEGIDKLYYDCIEGCLRNIETRTKNCTILFNQIGILEKRMARPAK